MRSNGPGHFSRGIEINLRGKGTSDRDDVSVSQTIRSDVRPVIFQTKYEVTAHNLFPGDRERSLIIAQITAENRSNDGFRWFTCVKLLCYTGKKDIGTVVIRKSCRKTFPVPSFYHSKIHERDLGIFKAVTHQVWPTFPSMERYFIVTEVLGDRPAAAVVGLDTGFDGEYFAI